jgi:hypothetical protein
MCIVTTITGAIRKSGRNVNIDLRQHETRTQSPGFSFGVRVASAVQGRNRNFN